MRSLVTRGSAAKIGRILQMIERGYSNERLSEIYKFPASEARDIKRLNLDTVGKVEAWLIQKERRVCKRISKKPSSVTRTQEPCLTSIRSSRDRL